MTKIVLNRPEHVRRLDEVVESFETAWLDGHAELGDYLDNLSLPADAPIAIELMCIDLHYRWPTDDRKRVDWYREEFPEVMSHAASLEELCHEEWRLRRDAGEVVSAEDYAARFNVDVRQWNDTIHDTVVESGDRTSVADLEGELIQFADAVDSFPAVGDTIGDFELVEELGRGTFGIVFLARQQELEQRFVALKLTSGGQVESSHLARLQHTNIVPIYSLHQFGTLTGICMPFMGRRTLQSFVGSRTSETAILQYVLEAARGLQHAHERGIVHRDLKPANILINDDGHAMLLDFNLADDADTFKRARLVVGGTLPYLSPEHLQAIKSNGEIGPVCDIYSLGVVLYQLLANRLPFPVHSGAFDATIDRMIRDRQSQPPSLHTDGACISAGLAEIVRKMLQPDVAHRYHSMVEVCEDLQRHQEYRPLKYAKNVSLSERIRKWCHRHPRLSSTATVASVAMVLLLAMTLALTARGRLVSRQRAEAQLHDAREQIGQVRALLSMPVADDPATASGYAMALDLAKSYDVFQTDWRERESYAALQSSEQAEVDHILSQTLSLLAESSQQSSQRPTNAPGQQRLMDAAERARLSLDQSPVVGPSADPLLMRQQRFHQAISDLRGSRIDEAISELEALREAQPYDIYTWQLLGSAYAAAERLSEAEGCFSICAAMWPDSHWGFFHRGLCRLDQKRYAEAAADFTEALNRSEDYVPALVNRGVAWRELNEFEKALQDFDRALQAGATQTRIFFLRSEVRSKLGDTAGAEADRATGFERTPTDEKSWIKRGLMFLPTDSERALADFQAALTLNPRSRPAQRNIAHIYAERQQSWDAALDIINQLIGSHNQQLDDVASRGVLLARLGRRPDALQDARTILSNHATMKQLFQVACIYSLTSQSSPSDVDVAISTLEQVIVEDPKWLEVALVDPDLSAVRSNKEFARIAQSARERWQRTQKAKAVFDSNG